MTIQHEDFAVMSVKMFFCEIFGILKTFENARRKAPKTREGAEMKRINMR